MPKVAQLSPLIRKSSVHQADSRKKPASGLARLVAAPETLSAEDVLTAQQTVGNQAVSSALAGATIQRDYDEVDEARNSVGADLGKSTMDSSFSLATENPWFEEGTAAAGRASTTGKVGSGIGIAVDVLGAGMSAYSGYKAHQVRNAPGTSEVAKEKAWKEEKTAAKGVGSNALSVGGRIAGLASSTAGAGAGVVTGGVDLLRNTYGMARSAHKAHQLGGWTGKGGMVEELEQAKNDPAKTDEQKQDAARLQGVAQFAHKTKTRTSLMKSLGMVGAGLGVAGGAAALAAGAMTPVGWGLAAGAAGIGLGMGAYKLGRGMWKRSHRRDKLNAAEGALGMDAYRGQGNFLKRGWDWMRGNDIKNRQDALAARKAELEAQTNDPDQDKKDAAQAKLNALNNPTDPSGKDNLFTRAMASEKKRNASTLTEQLAKDPSGGGFANRIGEALGVTHGGKLVQSRGWQFWKKKDDLDIGRADLQNSDRKKELDELMMRKLGSSG